MLYNRLAMGLSDGMIRIWDLSLNQTHVILMSKHQESSRQRISYLDWHPLKENLLAYSTIEGQVYKLLQGHFHNHNLN